MSLPLLLWYLRSGLFLELKINPKQPRNTDRTPFRQRLPFVLSMKSPDSWKSVFIFRFWSRFSVKLAYFHAAGVRIWCYSFLRSSRTNDIEALLFFDPHLSLRYYRRQVPCGVRDILCWSISLYSARCLRSTFGDDRWSDSDFVFSCIFGSVKGGCVHSFRLLTHVLVSVWIRLDLQIISPLWRCADVGPIAISNNNQPVRSCPPAWNVNRNLPRRYY